MVCLSLSWRLRSDRNSIPIWSGFSSHCHLILKHCFEPTCTDRAVVPTKRKFQVLSTLGCAPHDTAETEAPTHVVDDTNRGNWIKEEAVVGRGAADCVTSRKRVPHLKVEETPESWRGATWTCGGGHEIKKEGKVTINWVTGSGASKKKRSVQERVGVSHADVLTDGRKRHTM